MLTVNKTAIRTTFMNKQPTTYSTRRAAVRAARAACKKLLGPHYQAFEGPDYYIHPQSDPSLLFDRYYFELSPVVIEEGKRT